jgi:DNA-binding SARP family transcriptional activator
MCDLGEGSMSAAESGQQPLEIRLLGEIAVTRGGQAQELPASKKTRALLGYLVATGRPHMRERLCELLWDGPDDPRAGLRWALAKLRPVLSDRGPARLVTDREHVEFAPIAVDVDVVAIRALGDLASASTDALEAAAARFGGPFLEGLDLLGCVRFHAWCVAEREQLQSRHVAILRALIDRLADQPEAALGHARALLALDPLAESSHLTVMRLLGALGRVREALAAYQSFKRLLEAELGTRPSAELERARMALGRSANPDARPEVAPRAASVAVSLPSVTQPEVQTVGRARERVLMEQLLEKAGAGKGVEVLLILGDPGVGKSHLMNELRQRATAFATTVLFGRAFEAELVRPYGAWIDALRGTALPLAGTDRRADLATLLPELGAVSPTQDRARLFDAVAATLSDLSAGAPVLILFDDVQWLDEASAALLHFAVRALRGAPVRRYSLRQRPVPASSTTIPRSSR